MTEIEQLAIAIKRSELNTEKALVNMQQSIDKMAEAITIFYQHVAKSDVESRHNDQFKKETREFQEYARPILAKSKDWQETRSKLLIIVGGVIITSLAVLLGVKP